MANFVSAMPSGWPGTLLPLEQLLPTPRPSAKSVSARVSPPLAVTAPKALPASQALGSLNFVDEHFDLPAALTELHSLADPGLRLENTRSLLADLIEAHDFDDAIGLFRAAMADKGLPAGGCDSLYRALNQSLLEAGHYDRAIALNTGYGSTAVRDEVRRQIVDYLIDEGQTLQAAQLKGDKGFTGVARAELERLGRHAKVLGQDIYELWRRTVIGQSLGERIASNASADTGKQYRYKFLDYGNLACAYTVSRIFDRTRLDDAVDSAECNTLARQLKTSGFTQVAGDARMRPVAHDFAYQPGDIVFFTRKNKAGYGHVGVISKVDGDTVWMVNNSSAKRQVVEVRLGNYPRPVVGVLRPPLN